MEHAQRAHTTAFCMWISLEAVLILILMEHAQRVGKPKLAPCVNHKS